MRFDHDSHCRPGCQPGQELVRAVAGISADQHSAARPGGQLRQRQLGHFDVLSRRVRSGVPGPQFDGQRFAARPGAMVGERGQGVEPERLLPRRRGQLFLQLAQVRGKVCKVAPSVPGFVSVV